MTLDNVSVAKDARVLIRGKERPLLELAAGTHVVLQMSADTDPGLVVAITETTRKGNGLERTEHSAASANWTSSAAFADATCASGRECCDCRPLGGADC